MEVIPRFARPFGGGTWSQLTRLRFGGPGWLLSDLRPRRIYVSTFYVPALGITVYC